MFKPRIKKNKGKGTKPKVPLKKPVLKSTRVATFKLHNGFVFVLPKKQVSEILSFFEAKSVNELTKPSKAETNKLLKTLQSFSDKRFNDLENRLLQVKKISENQSSNYFKSGKHTYMPFEDLMQIMVAIKFARQSNIKL